MKKKKVHIIGIAGQLSGPLAKALKDKGWQVTGSDQKKVYPPITTYLKNNQISYTRGFSEDNISKDLDLVILAGIAVGSFVPDSRENLEINKARKLGLKIISQAEAIQRLLIKKESIVVAGTYGKTTTTAMLVSIFKKAKLDPSFMIGGISKNLEHPLRIADSNYSIVEGDEYLAAGKERKPKFLYYQPKYLLLTAARWEHQDVYKSREDYWEAFKKLISLIPDNGFVLANHSGENIDRVLESFGGRKIFYGLKKAEGVDWWAEDIQLGEKGSSFSIVGENGLRVLITLKVLGKHNIENALAAGALALSLGVKEEVVKLGLEDFLGIKRRLEVLGSWNGVTLIDDVSQSKPRVVAALRAVKEHYSKARVLVIFDPHYSGLLYKSSLDDYPGAFDLAERVLISRVRFKKEISKEERVLGKDILEKVKKTQKNAYYLPLEEELTNEASKYLRNGDVVVFMSSGGLYGEEIKKAIIGKLKEREK